MKLTIGDVVHWTICVVVGLVVGRIMPVAWQPPVLAIAGTATYTRWRPQRRLAAANVPQARMLKP